MIGLDKEQNIVLEDVDKVTLEKKERSVELNALHRILIDFKPLMEIKSPIEGINTFMIYKRNGIIYYLFDVDGYNQVIKTSDFTFLEKSLDDDEYFKIPFIKLKKITSLKKSEVENICYDTKGFHFEIRVGGEYSNIIFNKNKDSSNIYKNVIRYTSEEWLKEAFLEASYDSKNQILVSKNDQSRYPYKITFSDDIKFKLKNDDDNNGCSYYYKLLESGKFIQVITIMKYKEVYQAMSQIYIFNYSNNRVA